MSDLDFEEQIRLHEQEQKKKDEKKHGKTKVDDDGTVMEWDADKKAWFPKVSNENLIRAIPFECVQGGRARGRHAKLK